MQKEDIVPVSIYAPSVGAPKYIKQILTDIKGEIDSNTLILGVLTPLVCTSMDRSSRQKIKRAAVLLKDKIDQ